MSSGCGDVLSLEDLKTAKKHQLFEAEVITGRAGGISSGASIDYATNQATGQVQKTMPAILRDIGFRPASFDFVTGGTIGINERDLAVLWPLPSGDGDWYYWEGALPKVIPAASTPASTGGVAEGAWRPVGDITLRGELASIEVNKGASLIGNFYGGTVQQALRYVTPAMFGIFPETRATSGMTDYGVQLQAMIDYAVENNLYVDTQIPGNTLSTDSSIGFYTTTPIKLTGLAGLLGVLPIYVNGNTFNDTLGFNFAVVNANATFTGTTITGKTTKGNLNYDWIEVRNVVSRSGTVNGLLWVASRSTVKKLRANGFNGRGVWLAHAYDSTFQRCEVENSGNIDNWAFDAAFYTPSTGFADETNGLTISSLLIHNCTDRAWRAYGSKIHVSSVHEEATYSLNVPSIPSAQDTRTSLGYMNSYFSSTGGSISNVSIQPDTTTSTKDHVFAIGSVGTSCGNIYTTGTTVVMNGDPAQRGGFIGDIYTKDLYIIDQARTTVGHVESTGTLYGRAIRGDSPILGGFLTNISENVGNISNCTIRSAVTINPAAAHIYRDCKFSAAFLTTSYARVTLDGCIFSLAVTTATNTKMDFNNCVFNSNVTIAGSTLDVIFNGGQISGNLSFSSPGGSWLFPNPPRVVGSITGWVFPTGTAVAGSRTRHPAPSSTVGTTVERIYNGTYWVVTQKVPS